MKVEAASLGIVVSVLLHAEAGVFRERNVVAPGRSGQPQFFRAREEGRQESGANAKRASARDSLHSGILQPKC